MQVVSAGMLGGVLVFLPIALVMRGRFASDGLSVFSAVVSVAAVASPFLFPDVERVTPAANRNPLEARRRHLLSYGLLEVACFLCLVALMVSRPWWPLAALVVPLAFMVLRFPRD